jgi:DNA-binding beta-propeller fold protein YncE
MTAIRRLPASMCALVLAVCAVGVLRPGTPAQAGTPGTTTGPGAVVVDVAHKRVYHSSGASGNQVVAVSFDGRSRTVVENQYGATGMVLSADGRTLYVALAAGDAITAIDTETLTERARHATTAHACPTHLARSGSDVWFGYGCDAWTGAIGRLRTAVEPVLMTYDHQTDDPGGDRRNFERSPLLAVGGTTLAASQPHISPVNVRLYAVGDNGLAQVGRGDRGGSNLNDLAVSPDGKVLYTASGSQDHIDGFTADKELGGAGAWFTGQAPNSTAVSPDGRRLASGVPTAGPDKAAVFLHSPDGTLKTKRFALPRGERLVERGLAWAADGTVLAVVARQAQHPHLSVHIVDPERNRPGPSPWPADH